MPAFWLLKTEPNDYSWEDLVREGETVWDGVRAPAALRNLWRMKPKDRAFIYHTGKERAIVGIAEITGFPYPEPSSGKQNVPVVRLSPLSPLPAAVTLQQIKQSGLFPSWELLRLPRLSVVPVSEEQWAKILQWAARG